MVFKYNPGSKNDYYISIDNIKKEYLTYINKNK